MNRRLIPADILHPLTPSDLHLTPDPGSELAYFQRLETEHGVVLTPEQKAWYTQKRVVHDSTPDFLGVDLALPGADTALLLDAVCHPTDSDLEDS